VLLGVYSQINHLEVPILKVFGGYSCGLWRGCGAILVACGDFTRAILVACGEFTGAILIACGDFTRAILVAIDGFILEAVLVLT
jgi:hypothetical protein